MAVLLDVDPQSQPMALVEYAMSPDYDRIERALAKPARTDFTPTVKTFTVFQKGASVASLHGWARVATTNEQLGKKEYDRVRCVESLKDGTSVVDTRAAGAVERIAHLAGDGKVVGSPLRGRVMTTSPSNTRRTRRWPPSGPARGPRCRCRSA